MLHRLQVCPYLFYDLLMFVQCFGTYMLYTKKALNKSGKLCKKYIKETLLLLQTNC